jgi:hypothetical protein
VREKCQNKKGILTGMPLIGMILILPSEGADIAVKFIN